MLFDDILLFLCISLVAIPIALVLTLVISVRLEMDRRHNLAFGPARSLILSALALFEAGALLYALVGGSLWQGWLISAMLAGSFFLSVVAARRCSGTRMQRSMTGVFATCMGILSVYVFFTFQWEAQGKQIEAYNKAAGIRWQAKQETK